MNSENKLKKILGDSFPFFDINCVNCEYGNHNLSSFTINQRKNNEFQVIKRESDFNSWLRSMINDYIERCIPIEIDTKEKIIETVTEKIDSLLKLNYRNNIVGEQVWNQEFPDVVYKLFIEVLNSNKIKHIHSHEHFNNFSFSFIPHVIDRYISLENNNIADLLKYSIASGLSGLDLKGATAAASELSGNNIPMVNYMLNNNLKLDAKDYYLKLKNKSEGYHPLFETEQLLIDLHNSKFVLWFTDDIIESFFDLLLIQKILIDFPKLSIAVIPKNGDFSNDLNWQQLSNIINNKFYQDLRQFALSGRFFWSQNGPEMAAMNLNKLSPEIRGLIKQADFAIIKGCRIHELINGGFPIPYYTGFVVARQFSEIISGYSAKNSPLIFFKTKPYSYSFYGIYSIEQNIISISKNKSTIKDYQMRKKISSGAELVEEITLLNKKMSSANNSDKNAILSDIIDLSEKLINLTRETYNKISNQYTQVRWKEPHDLDKKHWTRLLNLHTSINNSKNIKLLDVATGNGRDLLYAQNILKISAIGIDNCDEFVNHIKKLELDNELAANSIFKSDMRDLSIFDDNTFDIVRQNASILHLPFIEDGIYADKAISESFRVLKKNGLIFISTKAGNGIDFLDTGEGLGGRFFQFHNFSTLSLLLERNDFKILDISLEIELRNNQEIEWLYAIAIKK